MTQCVAILVPAIGIPQRAAKGVDVTLRLVSEDETGAEHCQHDNPTIGQELSGGHWTPDGILQLEGEANFSLSWGTWKRTQKLLCIGLFCKNRMGPCLRQRLDIAGWASTRSVLSSFIRPSERMSRGTVTERRNSRTLLRVSCHPSRTSEHSSVGAAKRRESVRMFG
jgi:hypothetical protein